MALEKQVSKTFSRFNRRLVNLRNASEARERAIKQLAESLGVEIDLTRMPTPDEEYSMEQARMSSKRLLQSEEVKTYLRESEEDASR
jgi:hypothetical protein